jgi:hypothetical protein
LTQNPESLFANLFIDLQTLVLYQYLTVAMAEATRHIDDYEDLREGQQNRQDVQISHLQAQTFASLTALEASSRAHEETFGYELTTRSSEKKDGVVAVTCKSCGKGIDRQLKDPGTVKRRKGSEISGCLFKQKWHAVDNPAGEWRLTYPRGTAQDHNHSGIDKIPLANLRCQLTHRFST